MIYYRSRQYQGLIDTTDLRSLVKALRNNQVVWYAPDQDFGNRQSVFAQFMGINTVTLTTTARLAKTTGASVVYIDYTRLPDAQGYQLTLHPPLQDFPGGDDVKDARRVNELIEKHVREVPDVLRHHRDPLDARLHQPGVRELRHGDKVVAPGAAVIEAGKEPRVVQLEGRVQKQEGAVGLVFEDLKGVCVNQLAVANGDGVLQGLAVSRGS